MTGSIGKRNGGGGGGGGRLPPSLRPRQRAGAPRFYGSLALPPLLYLLCTMDVGIDRGGGGDGVGAEQGADECRPSSLLLPPPPSFPPHFICFASPRRRRRQSDSAPFPPVRSLLPFPSSRPFLDTLLPPQRRLAGCPSVCPSEQDKEHATWRTFCQAKRQRGHEMIEVSV